MVKLAFLMRIFGKPVLNEITTIIKIRNQFAHVTGGDDVHSFEKDPIRAMCFNLKIVEHYNKHSKDFDWDDKRTNAEIDVSEWGVVYHGSGPEKTLASPRRRYLETCGHLSARLDGSGTFSIMGDEPEPLP